MLDRRDLIRRAGLTALAGFGGGSFAPLRALAGNTAALPFGNGERPLVAYPGKRPLLQMTARPPQLETPFSVFDEGAITPNDAFFVRYHLADIPDRNRSRDLPGRDQGACREGDLALARRLEGHADDGDRRGQPMLGQLSRLLRTAHGRGAARQRCHGLRRWTGVPLKAVLDRPG